MGKCSPSLTFLVNGWASPLGIKNLTFMFSIPQRGRHLLGYLLRPRPSSEGPGSHVVTL